MKQSLDIMVKIMNFRIHKYYIASLVYMVASVILGIYLLNGLIIFLAWNMFLATLVYALGTLLAYLIKTKSKLWIILVVAAIWILFFPNSIYMLTDFIHFQNYTFFLEYSDIYNYSLAEWLVFGHVTIGALYAAKLGIASIQKIEPHINKYFTGIYPLALTFLFFLSSFGIFIGRFLRFNSWDVFGLITQIGMVFSHGTFLVGFIVIFIVLHWVAYFLFSNDKSKIDDIDSKNILEEKL
ncbi:MAG: DUF1361 domain-containing protein [Acholeplasmataceae bacterium]|nr:DUF1361 domain-containing protein [Acholeplasmataceae bacterium]